METALEEKLRIQCQVKNNKNWKSKIRRKTKKNQLKSSLKQIDHNNKITRIDW